MNLVRILGCEDAELLPELVFWFTLPGNKLVLKQAVTCTHIMSTSMTFLLICSADN